MRAADAAARWPSDGLHWAPLLVDGFVAGAWRLVQERGTATLVVEPLERLSGRSRTAVAEEGARLLAFLTPDAETHDVRVDRS